jgi:neutral/alkaline ceramidase-like enzyme
MAPVFPFSRKRLMMMHDKTGLTRVVVGLFLLLAGATPAFAQPATQEPSSFTVGFAKRDITPTAPVPMWGYGARHDMLSDGILDPLYAKAIVIEAAGDKVAIVGLDLGRGPTTEMMKTIRKRCADAANIEHFLISGSHTHHGPVIELTDEVGYGKGKYDDSVAYSQRLPELLIEAILEADADRKPATLGIGTKDIPFNRNRHTKRQPKATDPMLAVMRFDDQNGKPMAVLVNFAAHPVMTDVMQLKFSADFPGFMMNKVEQALSTNCVFMQGATGDLSPNPENGRKKVDAFGHALADEVIALAKTIKTSRPKTPSIMGKVDEFQFTSRADFSNPLLLVLFGKAFFPELAKSFFADFADGIPSELNTVLINGNIAMVGGSGEFFCNHSVRLKQRCYVDHAMFFGYCNGHCLYFPTIEAASEGGYGADATVAPVEVGAGERMMDRALINIYTMLGRYATTLVPEE